VTEGYRLVTDGACSANGTDRARGGWAAILTAPDGAEQVLTGGERGTTNNRMELTAAIEGLAATPEGAAVELVTDSAYVANAIKERWFDGWRRRSWRNSQRQPVANRDLWELLIEELERHAVTPTLVKGHAGHAENERADKLAQEAAVDPPDGPSRRPAGEEQLGFSLFD
jgi:ribonuclease HI